jgi:hypothetical protein
MSEVAIVVGRCSKLMNLASCVSEGGVVGGECSKPEVLG